MEDLPIAHHTAFPTPLLSENSLEDLGILTNVETIDFVVSSLCPRVSLINEFKSRTIGVGLESIDRSREARKLTLAKGMKRRTNHETSRLRVSDDQLKW